MILNFKGTDSVFRIGQFLFSSFTVCRDLAGLSLSKKYE